MRNYRCTRRTTSTTQHPRETQSILATRPILDEGIVNTTRGLASTTVVTLEEDCVDKDGGSHEHALVGCRGIVGERNVESVGVREKLGRQRLGFLENLANVRSVAVRHFLVRRENPEGNLAATLAAGVALGAAVGATATTARWRVNLVNRVPAWVKCLKGWNTVIVILLDTSKLLSTTCDGHLLVAAALATSHGTTLKMKKSMCQTGHSRNA